MNIDYKIKYADASSEGDSNIIIPYIKLLDEWYPVYRPLHIVLDKLKNCKTEEDIDDIIAYILSYREAVYTVFEFRGSNCAICGAHYIQENIDDVDELPEVSIYGGEFEPIPNSISWLDYIKIDKPKLVKVCYDTDWNF